MVQVQNLTPVPLRLSAERYGVPVVDAAPFTTADVPPNGIPGQVYAAPQGGDLEWPIAVVHVSDPQARPTITPDLLRGNPNPDHAFSRTRTFVNRTTVTVDLYGGLGGDARVRAMLFPGATHVDDVPVSGLWVARSAFSRRPRRPATTRRSRTWPKCSSRPRIPRSTRRS
jgi:hypothetical protein